MSAPCQQGRIVSEDLYDTTDDRPRRTNSQHGTGTQQLLYQCGNRDLLLKDVSAESGRSKWVCIPQATPSTLATPTCARNSVLSLRRIFHSLPESTSSCVKNVATYCVRDGSHQRDGRGSFQTEEAVLLASPFSTSSDEEPGSACVPPGALFDSWNELTGGSEAISSR